jgi:ATP-dependent helicase/nuclease subunit A
MSNLLIYQSSAGSGKTYKLAKEYLKLAFKFPGAFKGILAITFTNKATEEMKSRVLKFLIDLSGDKDKKLKEQLIEEGVKGEIRELAKVTLNSILHNYSDFSISTIDSFFNRVLRSFSKELKLQIGYDIELDQSKVLAEITEMMLKGIKDDEDLKDYLSEFILMKISEDKGWDIEKDIEKLGREIFKERYWEKKFKSLESGLGEEITDSRKKVKALLADIRSIIKEFEDYLKNIGDEAEKVMKGNNLEVDDFAYGDGGVMGFLLNKIRYIQDLDLEKSKRALGVYETNQGWYTKSSKKKEIIQNAADSGLYLLLKKSIDYINEESRKYNTAKELKSTIYTLGIFEDLNSRLNEYRKINKKLLQSDVNSILQGIISEDNSPFIYEKIGSNFKNILIDEFQDTSTFQWKNLLPLIINVLSERNKALVVGDVKQSIYRWRSGNMKLLLSRIYEDLEGFNEVIKTDYLKTNRRSRKEIVEFNNSFFRNAVSKITDGTGDDIYKELIHKAYSKESVEQEFEKQGGYVNINFFNSDKDSENTAKERAEEKVKEIITDVIKDGYNRTGKGK